MPRWQNLADKPDAPYQNIFFQTSSVGSTQSDLGSHQNLNFVMENKTKGEVQLRGQEKLNLAKKRSSEENNKSKDNRFDFKLPFYFEDIKLFLTCPLIQIQLQ
jgi:hypothetical protein